MLKLWKMPFFLKKKIEEKNAHDDLCMSNFCFTNWPLLFVFCMPDRWRHLSLLKRCMLISPQDLQDLPHQKKSTILKNLQSTKKLCFCDSSACHAMRQNRYHYFRRNLTRPLKKLFFWAQTNFWNGTLRVILF